MLLSAFMPEVPAPQRIEDVVSISLEDLSERRYVKLSGLTHAVEQVCWRRLLSGQPVSRLSPSVGMQASLSRLIFEGSDVEIPPEAKLSARATFEYGHTLGADGHIERRLLRLHTEVRLPRAPRGPEGGDEEGLVVGRIETDHLLTGPVANGGPHHAIDDFAFPKDGGTRFEWKAPSHTYAPPPNARRLDAEAQIGRTVVFGPMHTDPRGRVRSLAFPHIFEEVALERFAALGQRVELLSREVQLTYRKHCVSGQRVDVLVQSFAQRDGTLYAVGAFVPHGLDRRPACYVRMGFR